MGGGAAAFAIYDRDHLRLLHVINDAHQKNSYDLELFIHCSLDIVDEKAMKANEMFLGHLYTDQKYKHMLAFFTHMNTLQISLFTAILVDKAMKIGIPFRSFPHGKKNEKSFGFITNTGVRMILVLEANNLEWKDFDIRSIFKRFHNLYCNAISNPFHTFGDEIRSKSLLEAATQMISAHVEG